MNIKEQNDAYEAALLGNYKDEPQPSENYIANAMRTISTSWHGGVIAKAELIAALSNTIKDLQRLDRLKKALFYGKELNDFLRKDRANFFHLYEELIPADVQTIHGIIGLATEAGELLEALLNSLLTDKPLDMVNVKEELGDCMWYMAAIAQKNHFNFEQIQNTNIAKLRARFPEKFSETLANNRDLNTERKILENK
jgi:NTP pyrophosphatase (non-canonical NTP hydrolase)